MTSYALTRGDRAVTVFFTKVAERRANCKVVSEYAAALSMTKQKESGLALCEPAVFSNLWIRFYLLTAVPYGAEKPVMVFVAEPPAGYL